MDCFSNDRRSSSTEVSDHPEPAEKKKQKKNYRYVYDLSFFDITSAYFFMDLRHFRKVHLSVCRYMNGCLKKQDFLLAYFVKDELRKCMRCVIYQTRRLVYKMREDELIESMRFWKVKRVQIAKSILDCSDSKVNFFFCTREVEKIMYNGLCYASSQEKHSNVLYALCLLAKLMYNISLRDYDIYNIIKL